MDAIRANLLSPAVLFFALGLIAALTKSDLKFLEPLYVGLTIYQLVAIGCKGGAAIRIISKPSISRSRVTPQSSSP